MSLYPTTTLPPPSPSWESPYTFPLPESDELLLKYYKYIRSYLDRLWGSYVLYCKIVNTPEAAIIFNIIFAEMDYFEILNSRIVQKMSKPFRMQIRHEYII